MIAHRIVKLRKTLGLSQAQLAKQLHISTSAVGMYEQGRRQPNIEMLVAFANIFDVSLDYLIIGIEYPESKKYYREYKTEKNCPCTTCYWRKHNEQHFEN